MFDKLQSQLEKIFQSISGKGVISEEDLNKSAREIRIALIEADVALSVVKQVIVNIKEKALGQEVVKSISPGQMVIKIVQDEITNLLRPNSDKDSKLQFANKSPTIILMVGLQGSGKTTSTAKIANKIAKDSNKKILLASLDSQRPAAKEQLATLASQCNLDSLPIIANESPIETAKRAIKDSKSHDIIFLDTAGRINISEELMKEVQEIAKVSQPTEILLTCDSLSGQDAANVAKDFSEKLDLTGIVLTRLDGDGRGGAALSMKQITSKPIKFVGVGEKIEDIQEFDPERISSRILGMGDIVSLVEKASASFDEDEAKKMEARMRKGRFDLTDMQKQFKNIRKMGGFGSLMNLLPGMGSIKQKINEAKESGAFDEKILKRQESIILAMTMKERKNPKLLNASRKKRIAKGSGVEVMEVNQMLKQYNQMAKMMRTFGKMDKKSLMKGQAASMLNKGGFGNLF